MFIRIFLLHVYVIAWVRVKFEINFTSYSWNGNKFTQGAVVGNFAILAPMSGIYPQRHAHYKGMLPLQKIPTV